MHSQTWTLENGVTLSLFLGDITSIKVDCIVNSANKSLLAGSGVCGAIHRRAGRGLERECKTLGKCETGEVVITAAYKLPAKYVIHTVGPIYGQENGKERDLLYQCYFRSLHLAEKHLAASIAFPSISTGIHGYPIEEANRITIKAFSDFAESVPKHLQTITVVTYSDQDYESCLKTLKQFSVTSSLQ